MSSGEAVVFLLTGLYTVVTGMPQENIDYTIQDAAGGFQLPFLQFTNGGVRVNFAGFHAQAGLGGLLDGSRTGGGLHASAGTPWGAHAAAGLGGMLDGNNANAGGGLYARAGLGNGGPEAGAGLGGVLDGSGRAYSPMSGGLFAGATTGNLGASATRVGEVPPNGGARRSSPPSHTNIQIVTRPKNKNAHKDKAVPPETEEGAEGSAASGSKSPHVNEVRREVPRSPSPEPSTSAGFSGATGEDAASVSDAVPSTSGEKIKVLNAERIQNEAAPQPISAATAQGRELATVAQSGAMIDNNIDITEPKPGRRRWYRKRFRGGVPKRQAVYTNDQPSAPPAPGPSATDPAYPPSNSGSFFDDVFNIPISSLTAVNQMLRNNAG